MEFGVGRAADKRDGWTAERAESGRRLNSLDYRSHHEGLSRACAAFFLMMRARTRAYTYMCVCFAARDGNESPATAAKLFLIDFIENVVVVVSGSFLSLGRICMAWKRYRVLSYVTVELCDIFYM